MVKTRNCHRQFHISSYYYYYYFSPFFSSYFSQTLSVCTLRQPDYVDPDSMTLTYFSRSQTIFKVTCQNFQTAIFQKVFNLQSNRFKYLHYFGKYMFSWKKIESYSCGKWRVFTHSQKHCVNATAKTIKAGNKLRRPKYAP